MNKELSTGLYPVKAPTAEEMQARRDLSNKMETFYGEPAVASRLAAIEAEVENRRRIHEQKLDGIPQSEELQTHINRTFERESAEILRQLQRQPESA
jgi:hypothetical protein